MRSAIKPYLHFVPLPDIVNWSVQYMLDTNFSYSDKYPLVEIGSFLKRNKTAIDVENDKEYKRVTIKINNGGVFLRDVEKGINIGTKKQFIVSKGQFLLSKIDARNGAFGVVSEEVDGAIITGNFWTFDVDYSKINPYFLALITTTPEFIKFSENASNGTTNRHYLQENLFLSQKIPLPSLEEQTRILENHNASICQAEILEQQANNSKNAIEKYLFETLGIEKKKEQEKQKGLYFIPCKELPIWAMWSVNKALVSPKYEVIPLKNVLKMKSGSFLPTKNQVRGEYIVYGGNGKTGTHNQYCVEGKRIIIGRVGEFCGNVHLVSGQYWVTDNAFITEKINDAFNDEFLFEVLSFLNLNQFRVISAQPSLSQKNIENIPIPAPPLSVQKEIASHIQSIRKKMQTLRQTAEENRKQAIKEFEQEIFE